MEKLRQFLPLILVLVGLVALLDFFQPGLPITHDGQDHVARIANFYQTLTEGNLIPRWAANLNWGYGHPVVMFLYPLPSYFASFFHFLGFSLVDSTKLVFGLGFLLSGFFMSLWLKEVWGEEAGFIGGLLYMFAPYRFLDLYVRGAIGESFAFIWPPLIAWMALKLSREGRWLYLVGGSLSLAALILSHNALSLMFLPVIFVYLAFLVYSQGKKKRIKLVIGYSVMVVTGLMLAAFFLLPALVEGSRYTLRDIVTKGNLVGFESFSRLLWSPWNYLGTGSFCVQLGVLQWLAVFSAPFLIWFFWRKKDKNWLFLLFLYLVFWMAILMMMPISQSLYPHLPLINKFQFVWRFLSLAIFPPVIFLAAWFSLLPQKYKPLFLGFFLLMALLLNQNYWHAKSFSYRDESFYAGIYPGTTDTGESAPIWSIRFMEEYSQAPLEVVEGKAEIEIGERTTTKHEYRVKTETPTRLVENTLYFPGWQVLVDGQSTEIQFQDPAYRGLMTFNLSPGEHQLVIRFQETKFRFVSNLISLLGVGFLLGGSIISKRLSEQSEV